MIKNLSTLKLWQKKIVISIYDAGIVLISYFLSFSIRFGELVPDIFTFKFFPYYTIVHFITCLSCLYFNGLYRGIWRFSSTPDLIRVIKGALSGTVMSMVLLFLFFRLEQIPRSFSIINFLLLVMGLGGGRFIYRLWHDSKTMKNKYHTSGVEFEKVIIIGAGSGGEQLVREMIQNPNILLEPVGFIDDDLSKKGRTIRGIKVLGTSEIIPDLVEKQGVKQAFIAIPSASSSQIRNIVERFKGFNIEIKTLPRMKDIIHGRVEFSQLRRVGPEDLLGRESVDLDIQSLKSMISEKIVLITGAGGSIGRELCRQVCQLSPKFLIALDQTELFIYELEQELIEAFPSQNIIYKIADVRNLEKMESIFLNYTPNVVFHAAAYKHVPIMEFNPLESIQTNIYGTKIVASLSRKYDIEKFVLVSTDKAINPTNVMGTTKRIAEMVCLDLQNDSFKTKFMIVRFGNVLGSSGSVIPLFKKQIEKGGPITVTHKEIKRYFMSIPEATQLVIQAGALGEGGEIFVLKMGDPVKIYDLAKQMILLSGLKLGEDIDIEITGIRPGEKLFEELFYDSENTKSTEHPKILISKTSVLSDNFKAKLDYLLNLPPNTSVEDVKKSLKEVVEEYSPSEPVGNIENNFNEKLM
ncbi:MAG: polysaccharide biosynthesis protein [Halobacteriovoraceae bacterium]|nr:polysaccharide biosynthesis protein [Halobacteriovoraceae bacterium]